MNSYISPLLLSATLEDLKVFVDELVCDALSLSPLSSSDSECSEWNLTGVLREERAALAVDDLFDDWHVRGHGRGRDQADARHHGAYRCDEAESGVEPLDTQRVCRTDGHDS